MTLAVEEPGYPGHLRLGSQCVEDRSEIGEGTSGVSDLIPQFDIVRSLRKEIGRVSSRGFMQMKRTAALLFRSIHSRVGMLQ